MSRKELIKEYKQTLRPMGIYQIRNLINGKIFIGRSNDLKGIINRNRFQLKNNLHMNKEMQSDYIEFGEENFSFDILDYLSPREEMQGDYTEELKMLEEMWLEKLQPFNENGYNKKHP